MRRMIKISISIAKAIINILFLYPLYFLSMFFPRNKKIWVFGSHNNSFSDNSKYLFWYVADNCPQIEAVWITGNPGIVKKIRSLGYKAYLRWSLQGLRHCLNAKIYIYSAYSSDINFWTSAGALRFNLWHGIPLKRIEYDIKVGRLAKRYNSVLKVLYRFIFPHNYQKPHFMLSTSPAISKIFSSAFRININRCVELGYPRCDHFFWPEERQIEYFRKREQEIINLIDEKSKWRKVMIYMPTFREKRQNRIINLADFNKLDESLKKNRYILFYKSHPNIRRFDNKRWDNIIVLPSNLDIYPLLPFSDILITDYSSVMFDYLLVKKPIILLAPDIDSYENEERGFYFNYLKLGHTIGILVKDIDELISTVNNLDEIETPGLEPAFLWGRYRGHASEKITEFIYELLGIR